MVVAGRVLGVYVSHRTTFGSALMTTRIEYEHGTDINVIKACLNGNAPDLIAMGGEHSVEILQVVSVAQCCSCHVIRRVL